MQNDTALALLAARAVVGPLPARVVVPDGSVDDPATPTEDAARTDFDVDTNRAATETPPRFASASGVR